MKRKILIFVKAPVAGFVKTRLTPMLSAQAAAELSRAMAYDTVQAARQVADVEIQVAYRTHPAMPTAEWLTAPHPRPLPQRSGTGRAIKESCERPVSLTGEGSTKFYPSPVRERGDRRRRWVRLHWFPQEGADLGERLGHAAERSFQEGAQSLLIIGSDLPGLTPALLEKALGLLRTAPVVLGPSEDGGYYLIGLAQPVPWIFQSIRWSEPGVLEQTVQKLKKSGTLFKMLPRRADVDTPQDLRRVQSDPTRVAPGFQQTAATLRTL